MNSTDGDHTALAEAFFNEVLEPLALARLAAGSKPYFPMGCDPDAESYFEAPHPVSSMTAPDFDFPSCGSASSLIEALGRHWFAEGETVLAAASPRLGAIADEFARHNRAQSAEVDIFCYTLF